jgi:hypothetical protein
MAYRFLWLLLQNIAASDTAEFAGKHWKLANSLSAI